MLVLYSWGQGQGIVLWAVLDLLWDLMILQVQVLRASAVGLGRSANSVPMLTLGVGITGLEPPAPLAPLIFSRTLESGDKQIKSVIKFLGFSD